MKLSVYDLSFNINETKIIQNINLSVHSGQFVGIIGPNGSGKSTLLKNIYRAEKPDGGKIILDGMDINRMSYKESAKKMAVLRQESAIEFDYSVNEIVAMGRAPHHRLFEPNTENDTKIVNNALKRVGMYESRERMFSTLSGGEKQRVLIARALAQQTELLLLDEPTNHLDIFYKLQIMELVKSLDITVLAVIHDIDLVSRFCDYIYVIKDGVIWSHGEPKKVFTKEMFQAVFCVLVDIIEDKDKINIIYKKTVNEIEG